MAVAAVRPHAVGASVRRALPAALLAALIGLVVPLALRVSSEHHQDDQREAVTAAARNEVTNLMNISYATASRDIDRVIAGSTGNLKRQFEVQRAHASALSQTRAVLAGSVVSVGLLRLDSSPAFARVVVAASGTDTTGGARPSLRHYRWVLTLRLVTGHWLVSDAALEGVPS